MLKSNESSEEYTQVELTGLSERYEEEDEDAVTDLSPLDKHASSWRQQENGFAVPKSRDEKYLCSCVWWVAIIVGVIGGFYAGRLAAKGDLNIPIALPTSRAPVATPSLIDNTAPTSQPPSKANVPTPPPNVLPPTTGPLEPTSGPSIMGGGKPTNSPTLSPLPGKVTVPPLDFDPNSYPPDPYSYAEVTKKDTEYWTSQFDKFAAFLKQIHAKADESKKNGDDNFPFRQEYYKMCEKEFPKEKEREAQIVGQPPPLENNKPSGGFAFDVNLARKHLQYQVKLLCRYYMPITGQCDLSKAWEPRPGYLNDPKKRPGESALAVQNMQRHVYKIARKIVMRENIVIAVSGTSVMSGQDNCYKRVYSPTLERAMNSLLRPLGISTEVRNGGANGDGPAQAPQLACTHAIYNLDQVDYIHQFWDMMPDAPLAHHEQATRTWLSHPTHSIFALNLGKERVGKPPYQALGYLQSRISNYVARIDHNSGLFPLVPGYEILNPWFAPYSHWGSKDDGRCRMQTREGFDSVVMQNWHPGPLRNQHYSDMFVFFMAQATLLALDELQRTEPKDWENKWGKKQAVSLPKPIFVKDASTIRDWPPPTCLVSHNKQWNAEFDITSRIIADDENPFDELKQSGSNRPFSDSWEVAVVKHSSNTNGCQDNDKSTWNNTECNAHIDIDHGWKSRQGRKGKLTGDWLNLQVPAMSGPLNICISGLKGKKAPWNQLGLTRESVQVRIDNRPLELLEEVAPKSKDKKKTVLRDENMCIQLKGHLPKGTSFVFSIKAEQNFAFNVIWGW